MLTNILKSFLLITFVLSALNPLAAQQPAPKGVFKVDYEKFTRANGLQVKFHVDRSDPVVAVALTAHVGSAREEAGRTGFCPSV